MSVIRRRAAASSDDGVMLVELLIMIVLIGVVGSVVTSGLVQGMRTTIRGQERAYALTDLQRAADRVGRELRSGEPVALDSDSAAVDVFRDGKRLRYTFTIAGNVLQETREQWNDPDADPALVSPDPAGGYTRPVLSGLVAGSSFAYAGRTGTPLATPAAPFEDVDQVTLTLLRQLPQQAPLRLDTAVELRNTNLDEDPAP